jgi:hypothetical protein
LLFDISLQGGACINRKWYPSLITDKIKLDVPIMFPQSPPLTFANTFWGQ